MDDRSRLSQQQILQLIYDDNNKSIRTSGSSSSAPISGEMSIEIDAADGDNIATRPISNPMVTLGDNLLASGDHMSDSHDISKSRGYSIQVLHDNIDGDSTVTIQGSLDNINFSSITGSEVTVNGTDSVLYNTTDVFYSYVRVAFSSENSSDGTITYNIVSKG